jgi:hypothetical protein
MIVVRYDQYFILLSEAITRSGMLGKSLGAL